MWTMLVGMATWFMMIGFIITEKIVIAVALDTSMDYLAGLTDEKKPYPRK